ncbi:MoaD/ThiS family protein [Acanthopleuribacter pedis]|uniref:Molybdopterin synthase sulfur carrier subunit n=1 Tax=Acanthopleuribacter pedis TaxID=442870 RepID=A0A8J7U7L5_9BACT|nr:MoaD/ThiS family protein [Acanthopleuribacter pedis]MBO1322648.1 MoaD/ThiS family protein [Acanthopleuribacter pedis]
MPDPSPIQYKVLVFASLRDAVGGDTWLYQSTQPVSAAALLQTFFETFPATAGLAKTTRLAVNQEFLAEDRVLDVADEIALIPPVSGG